MATSVDATLARWTGNPTGTTAITSGTFTPPDNCIIVLNVNADSNVGTNITIQVAGGSLTWSQRSESDAGTGAGDGHASQWTAPVTTGASMTISVNRTANDAGSHRISCKAYYVTGQDASPIGATLSNGASATNNLSGSLTASGNGRLFGCGTDWNALGLPASTDTEDAAHYAGEISVMSAFKASDHTAGTQSINFDASGSSTADWNYCLLEILAAASGGTETTKTMTDTAALADEAQDVAQRVRLQSDTSVLTDQLIYGARRGVIEEDGIIFSDGNIFGARRGVVASELLTVLDDDFQYLRRTRQLSDTTEVTDGFVSWRRIAKVTQDTIDLLDGYSRTVTGAGTVYGKVMSDALVATDDIVDWVHFKRVMTDNADLLDGFSKTLIGVGIVYAKVLSDTTTLIDDNGQRWTLRTSRLTDAIGLSDALLRALARIRILGEDIEFSDGVIRFLRAVRVQTEPVDIADELIRTYFADQIFNVALVFGHREMMRMSHYDPMIFSARGGH